MKKFLLLLTLLVVALALAACGTTGDEPDAQAADTGFSWNGCDMYVAYILNDDSITLGPNTETEGRPTQIFLHSQQGLLTWEQLASVNTDISLRSASGTEYAPLAYGFDPLGDDELSIDQLEEINYAGLSPIFDLPEGEDPTSFTLLVAQNDEVQEIPLQGVALTAPSEPLPDPAE